MADGGAGDVWAVGAQTDNPQVDPYQPRIRHWDGSAWQVTPFPGDTETTDDLQLNQVAAAGGKAWIAALDGVNGGIFSWDGTSWTLQQFSSAYELWGVTAISAADAWTVGYSSDNSTLALHWNGTTWQDESPVNQTVNLQDVAASGPDNVWAAGIYYNSDGTGPYLAADHWNGTSWTEHPIPDLPGMGTMSSRLALPSTIRASRGSRPTATPRTARPTSTGMAQPGRSVTAYPSLA